ncbi:MAG: inositol monophosphatase [Clostridiales bacterium]|nr:inositol monophosphatase [Clostridiales bacterium]
MTDEILEMIKDAAEKAGDIILSAEDLRDADISEKSGHANFVTTYDVKVQSYLRSRLSEIIPDACFFGEEGDDSVSREKITSGICFIADPIDGTTNFIMGARRSAVSIAVSELGEVTAGVIYDPYAKEMYSAMKGKGAYLNGRRIRTRERELLGCVYMFGTSPYYDELQDKSWKVARALFDKSLDLRRGGSAALDLCWLASGRAGVFTEMRLSPWDYAAAKIILEEAGGKMTSMDGSPVTIDRPSSVLAACSAAYDEALETVKEALM